MLRGIPVLRNTHFFFVSRENNDSAGKKLAKSYLVSQDAVVDKAKKNERPRVLLVLRVHRQSLRDDLDVRPTVRDIGMRPS